MVRRITAIALAAAFWTMTCDKRTAVDPGPDIFTLIDSLTNISKFGIGFHPSADFAGFIAADTMPRFCGGIIGSRQPAANWAMKELVKKGVYSLPILLEHLDDQRPTRVTVGDSIPLLGAQVFGREYHHRNANESRHWMTDLRNATPLEGKYTLKIGDICFCLVGQIVNRDLQAVRYQPTSIIIVNSPVSDSILRQLMRSEWNTLTIEEHINLLMTDIMAAHDESRSAGAFERLKYYYPEYVKKLKISSRHDAVNRARDLLKNKSM